MISADRFLASKDISEAGWLEARRSGVTATQVSRAASGPGGFQSVLGEFQDEWQEPDNPFMKFGREWESPIAMMLKEAAGIMPNSWTISHETQRHFLCTPDGLSLDHTVISEIKTTGKDWGDGKIPLQYRRQVQWQLFVTGAEMCLFAWMQREERDGVLVPKWWDPKTLKIQRDPEMIEDLKNTAEKLWKEMENG